MKIRPYQLARLFDGAVHGRRVFLTLGVMAALLILAAMLGMLWAVVPVLTLLWCGAALYSLHRHHAFGATYQRKPRPKDAQAETILIDASLIGQGTRVRDLEVNLLKRTVRLGEDELRLTAKEFDLLHLFITNRGRPFTRNELLEQVWKYDYAGDARTVDVHIRRLREKIERNTAQPEFIMTKWKVGYYFTDED